MSDDILDNIFENAVKGNSLIKNRKILTIDYIPHKLQFRDEETTTIVQTLSVSLKEQDHQIYCYLVNQGQENLQ